METANKNRGSEKKDILPLFFKIGVTLFVVYYMYFRIAEREIPSYIRFIAYAGFLTICTTAFIYLARRKKVILANLVLFVGFITILEVFCFFMLGMPAARKLHFTPPGGADAQLEEELGTVPKPDSVYHSVLVKDGVQAYDVHYSIDHDRKRITPGRDDERPKHALFFGCSIAFGEGLNDDQTLAHEFQDTARVFNAYNFAFSGYGPHSMLARLQYKPLNSQVREKDGVAFYIFFWDHIARAVGTMRRYVDWECQSPYYELKNGKVVRNKLFVDGRKWTSKFYVWAYQTNIVNYFKIDLPLKLNSKHTDLAVELIYESKKEYQEQFGPNPYYCVIYPNYIKYTKDEMLYFKEKLKEKSIEVIDLSEFINYGPQYTLNGDAHPNAKTTEMLAAEIYKRIAKIKAK